MADVRAGDIIVHYSSGAVRALGLATGTAYAAPQPTNFDDDRPANWEERGQRLDVSYHELQQTIPLERISVKLQALSIADGPLNRVDGVKQGYLWRFSLDGLRVLREASDEPWPEWAEEAASTASSTTTAWDEERLFAALARMCTPNGLDAARQLYTYAKDRGADFLWNPGPMAMVTAKFSLGGKLRSVFGLGEATNNAGSFWVNFECLVGKDGPDRALTALAAQLREIPGVTERFAEAGLEQFAFKRRPSLSLDQILAQPGAVDRIEAALDQFAQTVSNPSDAEARYMPPTAPHESQRRIVKIAPGEQGRFWDECLAGGYICIGWDALADLRSYANQEEFMTAFRIHYPEQGAISANSLWSVLALQPGDLIVANRGKSEVLGVGEVVAPGYVWHLDRREFKHTVSVRWDTSFAGPVPIQHGWMRTIVPVSPELYAEIIARESAPPPPPPPAEPEQLVLFDAIMRGLEEQGLAFSTEVVSNYLLALQTKRFVILTGISGTGKTQLALAVARAFQPRVRVTRPADVPAGAYQFIVPQNFNRVGNLTIVLPDEFAAGVVLPPPDTAQGSSTIAVQYP